MSKQEKSRQLTHVCSKGNESAYYKIEHISKLDITFHCYLIHVEMSSIKSRTTTKTVEASKEIQIKVVMTKIVHLNYR
jgi:hypothetical protein